MTRRRSVRSGFEQRFLAKLREYGVLHGDRLVIGFSGGPDSLALALAIQRAAHVLELKPVLAHVDHGLRVSSPSDALRCEAMASEIGLPFRSIALLPGLANRAAGLGVEEQARRERYLALATMATAWRATSIVLGHQADDQAETILMHLVRGSGSRGLGGMRTAQTRKIPWWEPPEVPVGEFRILRPLLSERRSTIESYLEEMGATPLWDESNLADDFDRNWMRHHVLPTLQERWPGAVDAIARSGSALQPDSDYLHLLSSKLGQTPLETDRTLSTDILLGAEKPLAFRLIRRWMETVGIDLAGFDVVARIYDFVSHAEVSTSIEIGAGKSAVLADGQLMIFDDLLHEAATRLPLRIDQQDQNWQLTIGDATEPTDGAVAIASRDKPIVRMIQPGDRWAGTGRKVMEDLRAADIHPLLRSRLLAVVSEDGVLLIPAIYPTIHANVAGKGVRKGWIRWQKV